MGEFTISVGTQPALQRLERRPLGAVAEDRPLNGLVGPSKSLAGVDPSQFGLGNGVASGENPVLGGFEGVAGQGATRDAPGVADYQLFDLCLKSPLAKGFLRFEQYPALLSDFNNGSLFLKNETLVALFLVEGATRVWLAGLANRMVADALCFDGVWVAKTPPTTTPAPGESPFRCILVTYLPSIPEAMEKLKRTKDLLRAARDRTRAKISEKWRDEVEKNTLAFNVGGRRVSIQDLDAMLAVNMVPP
ncbi:hypothetical protein B0T26DRAFT_868558 [Lasiosphaeria miniovina]|uniref:Uncharacterized protein n=1 Tax=Lasiosphaeria miniovina TaxID=1954250 RepID=A0AA40B425_9PEZI|nr:uncharacterized protein B0T26DRAFT_868558 [Lasiosphaeria miniovina]KAK0727209.1 hypothetical protein B0T26DRAFT_868558 [Lasiosphaeria miniovina]